MIIKVCSRKGGTSDCLHESYQTIVFTRVDDEETYPDMQKITNTKELKRILMRQKKRYDMKIHEQYDPLLVIIKHIPSLFFQDDDIERIFINFRFYRMQVVFDINEAEYSRIPPTVRMNHDYLVIGEKRL
jgi:hypothetical protein